MQKSALPILLAALLTGCATAPEAPPKTDITPFSRNWAGGAPRDWQPFILTRTKAKTEYETAVDSATGQVVLVARAQRSASGLKMRLDVDPMARPRIAWQWRVVELIDGADNTDRFADDSPVRLLLFFDGDRTRLPAREQMLLDMAQVVSGHKAPYATLMYIWENRQPAGTVIDSALTGRLKMVVAGSGADRLGQWKHFERDYVEDFQRAFGEPPGRLIGVGVLTDTDSTGGAVRAYYGDIVLRPAHGLRSERDGPAVDTRDVAARRG